MRYVLLAALLAAPDVAHSQANLTGQALAIPPAQQNPTVTEKAHPARECLIEKASGKRVCHSRVAWKALAEKLGSEDAPR